VPKKDLTRSCTHLIRVPQSVSYVAYTHLRNPFTSSALSHQCMVTEPARRKECTQALTESSQPACYTQAVPRHPQQQWSSKYHQTTNSAPGFPHTLSSIDSALLVASSGFCVGSVFLRLHLVGAPVQENRHCQVCSCAEKAINCCCNGELFSATSSDLCAKRFERILPQCRSLELVFLSNSQVLNMQYTVQRRSAICKTLIDSCMDSAFSKQAHLLLNKGKFECITVHYHSSLPPTSKSSANHVLLTRVTRLKNKSAGCTVSGVVHYGLRSVKLDRPKMCLNLSSWFQILSVL
jgi:hypothetical protein